MCISRLAASQDVVGVTLGSILGHAACTAVAVIGGKHLAAHIDEKTVGVSVKCQACSMDVWMRV